MITIRHGNLVNARVAAFIIPLREQLLSLRRAFIHLGTTPLNPASSLVPSQTSYYVLSSVPSAVSESASVSEGGGPIRT